MVRNDMTVERQRRLTCRIVEQRKIKEISTCSQRRGRYLKAEEFPELGAVLEFAFGERDVRLLGGGD